MPTDDDDRSPSSPMTRVTGHALRVDAAHGGPRVRNAPPRDEEADEPALACTVTTGHAIDGR